MTAYFCFCLQEPSLPLGSALRGLILQVIPTGTVGRTPKARLPDVMRGMTLLLLQCRGATDTVTYCAKHNELPLSSISDNHRNAMGSDMWASKLKFYMEEKHILRKMTTNYFPRN